MARFALTKTTPVLLGMLALTACPSDDVPQDTEGTSTGEETTTMTPPPMTDTTVDPDSASDTGTSEDSATTAADPCDGVMCEPGEECIGGSCFACAQPMCEPACDEGQMCQCPADDLCCDVGSCGEPICPLPSIGGNHAPCLDDMGMTSDAPCEGGICVIDDEPATAAVCMVQGCEANCQCPPAPDTGNATVTCDDILGETEGECYLDCGNDETCPDGMLCLFGFVCLHTDAEPAPPIPPYGDCFNAPVTAMCEVGFCLNAPDAAACVEPCGDVADCSPAPPTGNATLTCANATADMMPECILLCNSGETCPDGMICYQDQVCLWPEIVPPGDNYGDCINPPGGCEPSEDTCLDDGAMMPGAGACSQSGCADATECPVAPATGDSVVSCGDFGDGNTCYLDCGMGETCPDGMACTVVPVGMGMEISACMWPFVVADFTCADSDLASAVGAAVAMGTTAGAGDDFPTPCSAGESEDVELQWTAPADGTYTFDTVGSDFDTILSVRTHCAGVDLACNDDIDAGMMIYQSELTVDLVAGQSVLIVIDGYNETGNYVLNIN